MSKAVDEFYKQKKYLSFIDFLNANPELLEENNEEQSNDLDSIVCPVCVAYNESRGESDQESSDTYNSNAQVNGIEGDRLVP